MFQSACSVWWRCVWWGLLKIIEILVSTKAQLLLWTYFWVNNNFFISASDLLLRFCFLGCNSPLLTCTCTWDSHWHKCRWRFLFFFFLILIKSKVNFQFWTWLGVWQSELNWHTYDKKMLKLKIWYYFAFKFWKKY